MKRKTTAFLLSTIYFMSLAFTGCGNSNIFGFSHSPGSNSSVSSLSSDASTALQNGNYAQALKYYQQILAQQPNNSEAIYGYSTADLSNAGLDISSLIASLIQSQNRSNNNSASSLNLAQALNKIARSGSSDNANASPLLPDAIIQKISTLGPVINDVLGNTYLRKIILGQTDGVIAPDNPDVNINIAFCLILRAAIVVYNGSGGAAYFNNDYTPNPNIDGRLRYVQLASEDLVSASKRLDLVVTKLNLGSNASVAQIDGNVNTLLSKIPYNSVSSGTDYYKDQGIW